MTTYTGLYVSRLSDGTIYSVQVRDSTGVELPLNPEQYADRGVQPVMTLLPNAENYLA
jgi:hypothetical protein